MRTILFCLSLIVFSMHSIACYAQWPKVNTRHEKFRARHPSKFATKGKQSQAAFTKEEHLANGTSHPLPDDTEKITTYFHIRSEEIPGTRYYYSKKLIGFVLTNIDSGDNPNWTSGLVTEFEQVDDDYFVKMDFPLHLSHGSKELWCSAVYVRKRGNRSDTERINYGGVVLSKIKLILSSTPQGAETYIIPNRVWTSKFKENVQGISDQTLQKFRVNTAATDTYAWVDQTVFAVLYRLNDTWKVIIHNTKPASIEQEQKVWIKF